MATPHPTGIDPDRFPEASDQEDLWAASDWLEIAKQTLWHLSGQAEPTDGPFQEPYQAIIRALYLIDRAIWTYNPNTGHPWPEREEWEWETIPADYRTY